MQEKSADGVKIVIYDYKNSPTAPVFDEVLSQKNKEVDIRFWSISKIILPFIVESIQLDVGMRRDVIDYAIECLTATFPHPSTPDSKLCAAALKIITKADFSQLDREIMMKCLPLILGSANLPEDRARQIFGDENYLRLFSDWTIRVNDVVAMRAARENQKKNKSPDSDDTSGPIIDGHIIVSKIGTPGADNAARVDPSIKAMVGVTIPNAVPRIKSHEFKQRMQELYPHMGDVIDLIVSDLDSSMGVKSRILVGPPGCGKTSFWRKAFEILESPTVIYACGGDADSTTFRGASRKWSTTGPSFPISVIANTGVANPVILLDEIEKVAQSRYNGNLIDVLLSMLDPTTARQWFDPHIEAPIDLSHIIWVATANTLDGMSPAFLDRWSISRVKSPSHEDARVIIKNIAKEGGCTDLDMEEIDAMVATWNNGSIRVMQKITQKYIERRNVISTRH